MGTSSLPMSCSSAARRSSVRCGGSRPELGAGPDGERGDPATVATHPRRPRIDHVRECHGDRVEGPIVRPADAVDGLELQHPVEQVRGRPARSTRRRGPCAAPRPRGPGPGCGRARRAASGRCPPWSWRGPSRATVGGQGQQAAVARDPVATGTSPVPVHPIARRPAATVSATWSGRPRVATTARARSGRDRWAGRGVASVSRPARSGGP